jgi:hypothetical protein
MVVIGKAESYAVHSNISEIARNVKDMRKDSGRPYKYSSEMGDCDGHSRDSWGLEEMVLVLECYSHTIALEELVVESSISLVLYRSNDKGITRPVHHLYVRHQEICPANCQANPAPLEAILLPTLMPTSTPI